jgi:argininosuccinate synthase
MERIVLGYTGSLNSSVAIPWLAERFGVDVIAVTLDLGQGTELTDTRERALASGALRSHVLDVRDEFAAEYILPLLQAGATGTAGAPLITAISRPLIAKKLIDVARMEGATMIAHCCDPLSDDENRLETALHALDGSIAIVAPLRESHMTPEQQLAYARERNIFAPALPATAVNTSANLWGRSTELAAGTNDEDETYVLTRAPHLCPEEPACLDVEFESGVPVRANGIEMAFAELIESIETIAGAHGVGRFDALPGGQLADVRFSHEAPAAMVLQTAHNALEESAVSHDVCALKRILAREYARVVEEGRWFTPAREAIDAFVASVQQHVTGTVRVELFKGSCRAVSCRVDAPLPRHAEPVQESRGH